MKYLRYNELTTMCWWLQKIFITDRARKKKKRLLFFFYSRSGCFSNSNGPNK